MKAKFDNYNTSWKLESSKNVTESHPVEVKYDIAHITKDTPAYNGGCRKQYGNEIGMFISQSLKLEFDIAARAWITETKLKYDIELPRRELKSLDVKLMLMGLIKGMIIDYDKKHLRWRCWTFAF